MDSLIFWDTVHAYGRSKVVSFHNITRVLYIFKYRVLKKCFIDRVYEPGEIIEFDGVAGEALEPIGKGPHRVEPRRFDIDGGEGLSVGKRAELKATRQLSPAHDKGAQMADVERDKLAWDAK